MAQDWTVQTEKGEHSAGAVWATLQGSEGSRKAALVLSTASEAAREILSSGMMYLREDCSAAVLLRIGSTSAARKSGCLLIHANEVQSSSRTMENAVLRELRAVFQLEMTECREPAIPGSFCHGAAS